MLNGRRQSSHQNVGELWRALDLFYAMTSWSGAYEVVCLSSAAAKTPTRDA